MALREVMNLGLHTFQLTEEDRIEYTLEQLKMGIADAKVEGHANANAINTNKITIDQEIIIILLIIFILVAIFKFLQHYIKKQVVRNSVQNV